MVEEKIFLNPGGGNDAGSSGKPGMRNLRLVTRVILMLALIACLWKAYDVFWLRHRYLITAYCDCPICINIPEFHDGKFASKRPVYWGGVAADKSVRFGSSVELVPLTVRDWLAVKNFLGNRRHFTVEDRGGKIRGRHIDLFFSESQGGHEAALHWGARRMRVKINGQLMN